MRGVESRVSSLIHLPGTRKFMLALGRLNFAENLEFIFLTNDETPKSRLERKKLKKKEGKRISARVAWHIIFLFLDMRISI